MFRRFFLIAAALTLISFKEAPAQCPGGVCPRPALNFLHRATRSPLRSVVRVKAPAGAAVAVNVAPAPGAVPLACTAPAARKERILIKIGLNYVRAKAALRRDHRQERRANRRERWSSRRGGCCS